MTKNNKLLLFLLCIVVLMFSFSFALVPLYNMLCNVLGINGKTNATAIEKNEYRVDYNRLISVQFTTTKNNQLNWDFYPEIKEIQIHPGATQKMNYIAKNKTNQTMTVQAVPSVAPSEAAKYLKKTVCFCFNRQTLKAGETIKMPVRFHISPKLPKRFHDITLSYTLFAIKSDQASKK